MRPPGEFQRLEAIFLEAASLPHTDRAGFLECACAGNDDERREVQAMLDAEPGAEAVLLSSVERAVASLASTPAPAAPARVGPYLLIREIGRGGMGTVYLAERADDEFHQQVAIKLISRSMESAFGRERFLRERQLLAHLNHPGIARLLDGGTANDGRPYFAMEFVDGRPLLDDCEARALDISARLTVFREVCAAVQYAHQSLVVHRDIKPGNILVTREGRPKLLDFGISKLLDADERPVAATAVLMLTPDYASPEQVRGESVTTGTDIYSLGCVLYEMLCGRRPHALTGVPPGDVPRVICDVDPPPPSRFRPLDRDLDTIVAKALQKEPAARYQTVEQLADDVARHLEGRPITARRPTVSYRVRKFVRRNRLAVAAVALATIGMVGGAAAALWQAQRASAQAAIAERRFEQGRLLARTFLFEVDEKLRTVTGTTETRRLIIERALAYLDNLSREAAGDSTLQIELARAYERIADVQGTGQANLGQTDAARTSLERAKELLEALDPTDAARQALSSVYYRYGTVLSQLGDPTGADQYHRRSLGLAEALFAARPDDAERFAAVSTAYVQQSVLDLRSGDMRLARRTAERALALAEQWAEGHPGDATDTALAAARQRLAFAQVALGDLVAARASYAEIIRLREALAERRPGPAARVALARAFNAYADLLGSPYGLSLEEPADALTYYRKALAIRESLVAEDADNAAAARDVEYTLANIAALERDLAPQVAAIIVARAVAIAIARREADPGNWETRRDLALIQLVDASVQARLGAVTRAQSTYAAVIREYEAILAREPSRQFVQTELMTAYSEHGDLLLARQQRLDARSAYTRAIEIGEAARRAQPGNLAVRAQVADTYERLARFHAGADHAAACDWWRRSLEVWTGWERDAVPSAYSQRRLDRATRAAAGCR